MKSSRRFANISLLRAAMLCVLGLSCGAPAATPAPDPTLSPEAAAKALELRANGAFGFPQREARVLCDTADLRLSIYNDNVHFMAQAILWTDGDNSLGKLDDGRYIGDRSELPLELGKAGEATPNVDRSYSLNPWPNLAGLHYQSLVGQNVWAGPMSDSKGRGAIRYVSLALGRKVRVDTYLIPLAEIGKKPGERFRFCFWAASPVPDLTLNSVGFTGGGDHCPSNRLPSSLYHECVLARGGKIVASQIPDDRLANVAALAPAPHAPVAAVIAAPASPKATSAKTEVAAGAPVDIKFTAEDGRKVDLASLRGKVVLVDFWATWCGPCMAEVPHVVEAFNKLHDRGFEVVGISFDHDKAALERVAAAKGMVWPIYFDGKGWQNDFGVKYGVNSIPRMWLIDKQGKIATTDARQDLMGQVEKLLDGR